MKKIISLLLISFFYSATAFAGGMIGIKYGTGTLESTASVPNDADSTKDADSEYGAIFAEMEIDAATTPVSVGIEYIPLKAMVGVDGSKTDSHLELKDHTTLYALASKELEGGSSIYGKIGYSMADISKVTANNAQTAASSPDDSLKGPMVGVGVQTAEGPYGIIARFEATYTMYDDVKVTTTENTITETKTAKDTELTTFSISIAKKF